MPLLVIQTWFDFENILLIVALQGLALRLDHKNIHTERFTHTIKRVLTEPSFTEVAKGISQKLRARPRTPTQEAAGESP